MESFVCSEACTILWIITTILLTLAFSTNWNAFLFNSILHLVESWDPITQEVKWLQSYWPFTDIIRIKPLQFTLVKRSYTTILYHVNLMCEQTNHQKIRFSPVALLICVCDVADHREWWALLVLDRNEDLSKLNLHSCLPELLFVFLGSDIPSSCRVESEELHMLQNFSWIVVTRKSMKV